MKAIGFKTSLPITADDSLIEFEAEMPTPKARELLVKIEAISVNPVDYKIRSGSAKGTTLDTPRVMGWDAMGKVVAVGEEVSLFSKGDSVFYAGAINRSGSNQEYQLVDERIAGCSPKHISIVEAAAMPLTSLTAWEILFDRIRICSEKDKGKSILIIGGAGGVGSVAIQLAKQLAGLRVIATASRPETIEWCKKYGADHVVDHKDLLNEMKRIGFDSVDFILDFVDLNQYWDILVQLVKPQGRIGSISDPDDPVNLRRLKSKSVSFHWELMFTRSMYETDDMVEQHHILNRMAALLDEGTIRSTVNKVFHGFSVAHIKEAHRLLETNAVIGKIVIKY